MKEHEHDPGFDKVANVLRRRWKMIASASLLGAAATGAIGYAVAPRYTAKAQLVVELPGANVPTALDEAAIETRVELLMSETHLKRLYAELGGSLDRPAADATGFSFLSWWPSRDAASSDLPDFDVVQRNINAYKERKSRVIAVTYTAKDPQQAATVANKAAELFLTSIADRRRMERDEQLKSLDVQVPLARAEVERAEGALQAFRISSGVAAESKRADVSSEEISELTRQLALAKSELSLRRSRTKALNDLIRTGEVAPELAESLQDPALTDLIRDGAAIRAHLTAAQSPRLDHAEPLDHINDVRSRIGLSANRHLAAWAEEAENIGMRVRVLEARLDMVRAASGAAREAELRMREMQREASASAQLFEGLLQKQKDLRSSAADPPDIRVASIASPPNNPSSPNPALFVLPGMVLAGMIASFMAILRDRLDKTVRSQRDVAAYLGTPCAGLVPIVKGSSRARPYCVVRQYPFAQFAEAMRALLLWCEAKRATTEGAQVVVVTSSVKREGKTVLAASLAATASACGKRVLAVDLDLRRPGLARALDAPGASGLPLLLEGQPATDVIQQAAKAQVDVIGLPDRVARMPMRELEALPEMLRTIGKDYDLVIVDAGALLQAPEVTSIAMQADLVLMAVRWGATRRDLTQHALDQISGAHTAVVVTQVDLKKHARYRFGDVGEILARLPQRGPKAASV